MAWKKHERARKLMEAIGPYLYGTAALPKPLNDLFLRWIETHDVPTYREIQDALRNDGPRQRQLPKVQREARHRPEC